MDLRESNPRGMRAESSSRDTPTPASGNMAFIYRFDAKPTAALAAANLRKLGIGTDVRFVEPRFWELWACAAHAERGAAK